ncbi:hypothetical protein [Marinicellulosiphila megalodicopiae]|uniref:hypothetical protein n=1 Tax=Marinicellulosiphila megalodicopiae TaxID=2724896 RepID=UPI003BB1C71B
MSSQNQPDIEIYVKTKDAETIKNWLSTLSSRTVEFSKKGDMLSTQIFVVDHIIDVNVLLKAQSGFSSIWFDSQNTTWNNDLACAQQFVQDTQIQARCIKSSWEEDETENPDCWLNIDNEKTTEIIWK